MNMKILYMSISPINMQEFGIYSDLIDGLANNGHQVTLIAPCANKTTIPTKQEVRVVPLVSYKRKNGQIASGLQLLYLPYLFKRTIRNECKNDRFDLVLYATPPITLEKVVKYAKKRFGCKSYLMLKDIFPQNALDIGIMKKTGFKGMLYKFFRAKEINLYKNSDRIGCMSQANVDYILSHNIYLKKEKIELFPNALKIIPFAEDQSRSIIKSLEIPDDKLVFLYGGNLGKPQGLDFMIDGILNCISIKGAHFIIAGRGTEKKKVFDKLSECKNVTILEHLPKQEYDKLCLQCDVGMVLLDKCFTIPNFPSRILSYMKNAKPILAFTDRVTDIQSLVVSEARCGIWYASDDVTNFYKGVRGMIDNKNHLYEYGQNAREYFVNSFDVNICVKTIEDFVYGE